LVVDIAEWYEDRSVPFLRVSGNGSVVLGSSGERGAYRCERLSGERDGCSNGVRIGQFAGCSGGGRGERPEHP
jgi:hypothetical protein